RRARSARSILDIKNSFGEFVRTHRGIPEVLKHLIQGPPPYDPKLRASPRFPEQRIGSLATTRGKPRGVLETIKSGAKTCLRPCLTECIGGNRRQFTGNSCSKRSCRRKVSYCSASRNRHL